LLIIIAKASLIGYYRQVNIILPLTALEGIGIRGNITI